MTDTEADESGSTDDPTSARSTSSPSKPAKRRRGRLGIFLREVVAEVRKVVRPTRQELVTYTSVVIVFVVVIMTFVSALDFGVARLMSWAFGG